MGPSESSPRHPTARGLSWLVIAATMLFQAVNLRDEYVLATLEVPTEVNDHIFHFQLLEGIAKNVEHGGSLTDPWIPEWGQGFPVLRYYQHLPHLAVVAFNALIPGTSLFETFKLVNLLLLILIPFSFAIGARWLGGGPWVSAVSAVISVSLSVVPDFRYGFGIQTGTFTWDGGGLFPQLFATVMAPLALSATVSALVHGRREGRALCFLWLTWMSHLVLGYAVCLLAACAPIRSDLAGGRLRALARLGLLYVVLAISVSALLAPSLLEAPILSHSIWEDPIYWDSHGAGPVLGALVAGKLLDGGQFPAITLAVSAGLIFALGRVMPRLGKPEERGLALFLLVAFVVALVIFFGRHALGGLASGLLPFSSNLPFHRFICAVQLIAVWLGAFGLVGLAGALFRLGARVHHGLGRFVQVGLVIAALVPGISRAVGAAETRVTMRHGIIEATRREWPDAELALARVDAIRRVRGGRAYAGASWDWGRDYRVGGLPMYLRWATHDVPAISYMFHTMGRMSDIETSFSPARKDHWDLFDVRVMMAPSMRQIPDFAHSEGRFGSHRVARVDSEGALGLVRSRYFVDTRHMSPKERFEFAKAFVESTWHAVDEFPRVGWRTEDAPRAGEITWATPAKFPPLSDARLVRGTVAIEDERDDAITATVELGEDAMLLARKTFHPAWRVTVDGKSVEPVMLAPSFLGVPLRAGRHAVHIEYRGSGGYAVVWWTGPLLVVAGLLRDGRRRRAERASAPTS